MAPEGVKRKISAILSADVAGYSKLMEADEESTVRTIESYRKTVSSLIEQHNGRVVDSPGDNILSEFGSVVDAVQCADEVQHILRAENAVLPEARRMEFRIGINLGDVIEAQDRIYGDGVNIASRIEGFADPGGICISGTAYDQIVSKLALEYEDLGKHTVKNISRPVHVYRIPTEPRHVPESGEAKGASLSEKPSVAVLPFDNMSGDPDQEYFSDGTTEEIITKLSISSLLTVIARNSTFFYKGKQIKIQQIGEELGARYIVEGSVRKAGDRVRITSQLIDADTEGHIWAETFERELSDIFVLQDEIAHRIVANLNIEFLEAEKLRVRRIPTDNLSAYDHYLRGMDSFAGTWLPTDSELIARAREHWGKAIEADPEYVEAYAAIGSSYMADHLAEPIPEILEKAMGMARMALNLDDTNPTIHVLLSEIYLAKGQFDWALKETERAIH